MIKGEAEGMPGEITISKELVFIPVPLLTISVQLELLLDEEIVEEGQDESTI